MRRTAKRSQSSGAAPEESNTKRRQTLSQEGSVGCGAREKVPELWGGSGRATKRSLWKALLDAARAKWSRSSGAAPEESKCH